MIPIFMVIRDGAEDCYHEARPEAKEAFLTAMDGVHPDWKPLACPPWYRIRLPRMEIAVQSEGFTKELMEEVKRLDPRRSRKDWKRLREIGTNLLESPLMQECLRVMHARVAEVPGADLLLVDWFLCPTWMSSGLPDSGLSTVLFAHLGILPVKREWLDEHYLHLIDKFPLTFDWEHPNFYGRCFVGTLPDLPVEPA